MVPILSGILLGSRGEFLIHLRHCISIVYVTFMAITYSLLGILSRTRKKPSGSLASPFFNIFCCGIFFAMGFSMLGSFSIHPKVFKRVLISR